MPRFMSHIGKWLFGSIRGRILLLVLLTAVPLVGERVRGLEVGRQDLIQMATRQLRDLANDGIQRQTQMVTSAQALLRTIAAAVPAVADPDDGQCQRLMDQIGNPLPAIRGILIANAAGTVTCTTMSRTRGLQLADRQYFRDTLQTGMPVVSDVLIGRASSDPTVVATIPVRDRAGRIESVLLAALRLDWMNTLLAERIAHSDIVALIIDRSGTVVARQPAHGTWKGLSVADLPMGQHLASEAQSFTAPDLDGVPRIFTATQLDDQNATLVIGLRESDVLGNISRQVRIAYGSLALVTLVVLLAAWFGGNRFIVRPIQTLASTASAVGRGDYAARPSSTRVPEEFRPLAEAIGAMAARLRERESAMKRANEHLGRLAQIDALTGLSNRGSFDAQLRAEHERARDAGVPLALLLIDVDHFKAFNDLYGHVAGDACLREVAQAITQVVRGDDFAARYGGEEFVIVGPGMTAEAALAVATRLNAAVRALKVPHERSPHRLVTISIGIASAVPRDDELPERLVEEADVALYAAKKKGRDCIATSADVFALAG
jgi:diguanylate cyclase (GGDEF)-like protein